MTTPEPALPWGDTPAGTQWPDPDTPVLLNRELRPDSHWLGMSRFRDDRWDLNPAIFEEHSTSLAITFTTIPAALRPAAKFYIWQLLNHTEFRAVRGATNKRLAVRTVATAYTNALQFVLQWFAERGITAFCQVTQDLLDDYLDALDDEDTPIERRYRRITEVRRLWAHRDILPPGLRLPDAPPWAGADTQELLGRRRGDRENRTRRIAEPTMQMLLRWALRFCEDFAEDILAAHTEYRRLDARTPEKRRALGNQATPRQPRHQPGELAGKVTDYLADLRERGASLPGVRDQDGQMHIRWRLLAAIWDSSASIRHTHTGRLVINSGLPISEHAALATPITGRLDGQLWRDAIGYDQAPGLARLLSTACFILVAYLSGARVGEVLNLRRGCVGHDTATGMWLMSGLYFKGAEDENGNKIPEGTPRPEPWVVLEIVAHAVAVLERLHDSHLLFPRAIGPHEKWDYRRRHGSARSDHMIAKDLAAFVSWVNTECARRGRADAIPDDGRGNLAASRFRRTLAWFIRRRPRGLIAATIQYGHAHTRMLQGYAGSYESGFPDEYAFEDWLYRLECLADDEDALRAGEHVSGPAAGAYRQRVTAASREFAGRVLTSDKQAHDLLNNPLLQIHHGGGMTCVFNPATAACELRAGADDQTVTPDIDDCRPKCPNLARTDRDINHVKRRASELAVIVDDPLAPPLRHARERGELARLRTIIQTHEQGQAR